MSLATTIVSSRRLLKYRTKLAGSGMNRVTLVPPGCCATVRDRDG